jgi:hypothetical protein
MTRKPLYCTACHTKFDESCWRAWQRCPLAACHGELRDTSPAGLATPKREPKAKMAYPLFDAAA